MISTADALDLMTLITACHRRTAPRMDDREVAIATATTWAELFNAQKLEMPDLTASVKLRAQSEADAPEPAEIIRLARQRRAERCERETPAEREAREDRRDAALAQRRAEAIARGERIEAPAIQRAAGTDMFETRLAEMSRNFGKVIPDA